MKISNLGRHKAKQKLFQYTYYTRYHTNWHRLYKFFHYMFYCIIIFLLRNIFLLKDTRMLLWSIPTQPINYCRLLFCFRNNYHTYNNLIHTLCKRKPLPFILWWTSIPAWWWLQ